MNSSCSSPSPPQSSSLKAATLPEAAEVKVEDVDMEPCTSASLDPAPPSPEDTEEDDDEEEVEDPSAPGTPALPTGIDMNSVFQNHPALQALLGAGAISESANLAISRLFAKAPTLPGVKKEGSPQELTGDTPKKTRLKVFSNGFFMTFDKVSSCRNKHFWRCEYKNTCKARMHTDILSEKIITFIHDHNHSPPTPEEVRLYGLDPTKVEGNRVYIVGNMADPNQRRKIRKQVADREAAQKRLMQQQKDEQLQQQTAATIAAARAAIAQAAAVGGSSSSLPATSTSAAVAASLLACPPTAVNSSAMTSQAMLLAQLPFMNKDMSSIVKTEPQAFLPPNMSSIPTTSSSMMPGSSGIPPLMIPSDPSFDALVSRQNPVKRRARDHLSGEDDDLRRDPMFEPTFEIARKLRKLWKGEPRRYPRTVTSPSRHFDFFISRNDGTEEHLYIPMRIEQRDETHLKEALQEFVNQKCIGMLLFGISPKISVMFNQPMLSSWDNQQFFLLDISNPSRWRLMYVDDRTV